MKKLLSVLAAVIAALALFVSACSPSGNGGGSQNSGKVAIKLRSDENQALKVGDSMQIVCSVSPASLSCLYESTDKSVVTVDSYGSVTAVGVGKADVVLSVENHADVTAAVHFTVTRNFFMTASGYHNGSLDMSAQEQGGKVYIKDGQAQMLVNAAGEEWYFTTHLERTGFTEGDIAGGWGVGSFLVNKAFAIGDVMYWYAFRSYQSSDTKAKLYYGGWRYDASVSNNKETPLSDTVIDISKGVDVEIYRTGTTHYFSVKWQEGEETKTLKHTFEVPLFAGKATFPGVFGQRQKITVSNYDCSADSEAVNKKLSSFQKAENITTKVVDSRLFAGETYKFVSTVTPDYTIDKGVKYSLKTPVEGVSVTADGLVTVSETASGEVIIVSTATSDPNVTCEHTFSIVNKAASSSALFDEGAAVGNVSNITANGCKILSGNAYIPLKAEKNSDWYLTATVKNDLDNDNGTKIGLMGASAGFTDCFYMAAAYNGDSVCPVIYGSDGGAQGSLSDLATGEKQTTALGLLKKGDEFFVFVNGKLVKKCAAEIYGCVPALYSEGARATFTDISLVTDGDAVNAVVEANPFIVGQYVEQNVTPENKVYKLAHHDFGSADDMNWAPVNDYANGLKFTQALTGDYTIEFNLSGITKYNNANRQPDGKILIYLRSERTTCSLQFVIKNYKQPDGSEKLMCKFVCNLDDATWTEHDLPEGINLLEGAHDIKVVKTAQKVQLFIDGNELFAGEAFMNNTGYWDSQTVCTPGIGTFLSNATVTNPVITKN